MPIDASIPLGVKPVQLENPLSQMAQVLGLQAAQTQNAVGQYGLAKAQRQDDETNKLMQLLSSGVDPMTPEGQQKIYSVAPTQAAGYIKGILENKNVQAQTGQRTAEGLKNNVEAENKTIAVYRDAAQSITDPQSAIDFVTHMHSDPRLANSPIARVPLDQAIAQIPQDPAQLAAWKQQFALGATKFMELNKPTTNVVNTGSKTQMVQTPGLGGAPTVAGTFTNTQSPDNAASNATHLQGIGIQQAGENTRQGKTLAKDYAIAGMNPDGTPKQMPVAADGSLDLTKVPPEDLAAAYRYKADGTLPPNMGRGAQGAAESKRIRSIATAIDAQAGESPEDARIRQLATKGDIGAIAAMRKREVQIAANVKNFDFNADQVLQLSQKVDRTGVPLVNAWINAGRRSVTGNPDLSAFDVAVKTTVNEFAQIVGGTTAGATTEGEKKKAEALLNAQQTPEQVLSVINQMRIESKNRMESFTSTRKGMMPTNRPAAAPAPAETPTAAAVPPDIAAILQKHGGK